MRTKNDVIEDLKKIWGENWQNNMEMISAYHSEHGYDAVPQSQIDASNNLIWELNRIEEAGL